MPCFLLIPQTKIFAHENVYYIAERMFKNVKIVLYKILSPDKKTAKGRVYLLRHMQRYCLRKFFHVFLFELWMKIRMLIVLLHSHFLTHGKSFIKVLQFPRV